MTVIERGDDDINDDVTKANEEPAAAWTW